MAENLILRILEVDVASGNHRLTQLFTQADDGAVKLPQLFHIPGNSLFQHEHIVADGLDLKKIVEGRNVFQLFLALVIDDSLKQLARFTGRADDQTLPVLHNLRLGHPGETLEELEIGIGHQMIKVSQAHLVLGKENDMVGTALAQRGLPLHTHHIGVDGLQGFHPLLPQLIHKAGHDQAAGHSIVRCPVVVKLRQTQGIGHNIQLMLVQLGHQDTGQH